MTDKFTITLEYDRDEILMWAERVREEVGNDFDALKRARDLLDWFFPAWRMDQRSVCMVELMFRPEGDMFRPMFVEKLAELDELEKSNG